MKNLNYLNKNRVEFIGMMGDEYNGFFIINIKGEEYKVMASNGNGWDHVSVSHKYKIPSWKVMCIVKDMFFEEDETVIQFHPKKSEYVNIHPNCLHLWRKHGKEHELPPKYMI